MPETAPDPVFRRADEAVHADVSGLTVMLDLDAGSYYGLNEVGTRIWGLLAEPRSLGAIAADLHRTYEVEEHEAREAARTFLEELVGRGVVAVGASG